MGWSGEVALTVSAVVLVVLIALFLPSVVYAISSWWDRHRSS